MKVTVDVRKSLEQIAKQELTPDMASNYGEFRKSLAKRYDETPFPKFGYSGYGSGLANIFLYGETHLKHEKELSLLLKDNVRDGDVIIIGGRRSRGTAPSDESSSLLADCRSIADIKKMLGKNHSTSGLLYAVGKYHPKLSEIKDRKVKIFRRGQASIEDWLTLRKYTCSYLWDKICSGNGTDKDLAKLEQLAKDKKEWEKMYDDLVCSQIRNAHLDNLGSRVHVLDLAVHDAYSIYTQLIQRNIPGVALLLPWQKRANSKFVNEYWQVAKKAYRFTNKFAEDFLKKQGNPL